MNILDNFKNLLFYVYTFDDVPSDVLDSESQPGSGALGLTGDFWHIKYENKKKALKGF